jgi:hypothetical protein
MVAREVKGIKALHVVVVLLHLWCGTVLTTVALGAAWSSST